MLTSGGVDSAVLVADRAREGWVVQPIYIRFGLAWEAAEEAHLRRFLDALPGRLRPSPLVGLDLPIADVYGAHWSVSGADVPDETTPDERGVPARPQPPAAGQIERVVRAARRRKPSPSAP